MKGTALHIYVDADRRILRKAPISAEQPPDLDFIRGDSHSCRGERVVVAALDRLDCTPEGLGRLLSRRGCVLLMLGIHILSMAKQARPAQDRRCSPDTGSIALAEGRVTDSTSAIDCGYS